MCAHTMHTAMYMHAHVHTHEHTQCMQATHVRTYTCVLLHTQAHVSPRMSACTCIHSHTHVSCCTHKHTCIHSRTHTCTHCQHSWSSATSGVFRGARGPVARRREAGSTAPCESGRQGPADGHGRRRPASLWLCSSRHVTARAGWSLSYAAACGEEGRRFGACGNGEPCGSARSLPDLLNHKPSLQRRRQHGPRGPRAPAGDRDPGGSH